MRHPPSRTPLAIFRKDLSEKPPTGQCDCDGGDCACSLPSLSWCDFEQVGAKADLILRRAPGSQMLPLNEEYAVFYSPFHLPMVLNQEAQELLSLFEQPNQLRSVVTDKREMWGDVAIDTALANMCIAHLLIEAG